MPNLTGDLQFNSPWINAGVLPRVAGSSMPGAAVRCDIGQAADTKALPLAVHSNWPFTREAPKLIDDHMVGVGGAFPANRVWAEFSGKAVVLRGDLELLGNGVFQTQPLS